MFCLSMPMQSICCQALKGETTTGDVRDNDLRSPRPTGAGGTGNSPALVTADHVAVVVGEPTDAPGDIGAVAAVL